jgi:hypothetical protein
MTVAYPHIRYALVVPASSLWHAQRVPAHVRRLLRIDLYEVADDGHVHHHPPAQPTAGAGRGSPHLWTAG